MSKTPNVRVVLTIPRDEDGPQILRAGKRPYADAEFTEGRAVSLGPIRRDLSDDQGEPRMMTASVTLDDNDGVIRGALAENETRFLRETEAHLQIISEESRKNGGDWRTLARARVEKVRPEIARTSQTGRSRRVTLQLIDALAPFYDQFIPQVLFERADFPDIHRDLENTPVPLIGGEHSDAGAQDLMGGNAEKGMVPAIYVGGRQTITPGNDPEDPDWRDQASFLAPPDNVDAAVDGATGSTFYFYGVTALSAVGETVLSTVAAVEDGPAVLSATDSITLTWDPVEGATGYIVYGRRNSAPIRRLKVLGPETEGASPDYVEYVDTGADVEHAPAPPAINMAQVPYNLEGGFFWDFYIVCLGVVKITGLYASDLSVGVPPTRIYDTAFLDNGTDFLTPWKSDGTPNPGWPHPNPWIEINGKRFTAFYGRGPRSYHHIHNFCTVAVSTCGYEDGGDGSGEPITQAFPLFQHFLTQFVPDVNGETYRTGLWRAVPQLADGTPMYQTSRFEACQDLTKLWLDDEEGYQAAIYIREPITVREFIAEFCRAVEAHTATNHHGQAYPVLYDTTRAIADGRVYRERIEIVRLGNPELDDEHVEPEIRFQYDYDPDSDRMRNEIERVFDQDAMDAQKQQYRDRGVRVLRYTRDAATARHAMQRRRDRLKYPRWRQSLVAKYSPALEEEPGDQILIRHRDGATAVGWLDRPFVITSSIVDPDRGEVELVAYDVLPLLAQYAEET